MASAFYTSGLEKILDGSIDVLVDTIKASLIDTGTYTFSAAHDFEDDLTGQVGTDITINNKTATSGIFDTTDDSDTWSSVSGASVEAIVIYKDTGTPATSPLICYIDGFTAVTPNGGDITVDWDDGTTINGIFQI
jgi:hypothetical protein